MEIGNQKYQYVTFQAYVHAQYMYLGNVILGLWVNETVIA